MSSIREMKKLHDKDAMFRIGFLIDMGADKRLRYEHILRLDKSFRRRCLKFFNKNKVPFSIYPYWNLNYAWKPLWKVREAYCNVWFDVEHYHWHEDLNRYVNF